MLAVKNAANSVADEIAGAFYLPIEVDPQSVSISEALAGSSNFFHKARGIFNGDYASALDAGAARDSRFYNFYVTKEGDPYGNYNRLGSLRPADFEKFLNFASSKIIDLAGGISSGEITAFPYRLGNYSPCSYCEYKPVCRFDWQINSYNQLSSLGKEQVLEQIANDESKKV